MSFLIKLCSAVLNTSSVDTNFSRDLQRFRWKQAYQKYFLHATSSSFARRHHLKPTLASKTILIPYHIHGSHWVAVARKIVNDEIYFLYADDLNLAQTEESVKSYLSTHNTSMQFNPTTSKWINCVNYTYHPHSNECGPRSLLALSIMATHPQPSESILIPFMHPNLALICRWWVAKSLISTEFDITPFSATSLNVPPLISLHTKILSLEKLLPSQPCTSILKNQLQLIRNQPHPSRSTPGVLQGSSSAAPLYILNSDISLQTYRQLCCGATFIHPITHQHITDRGVQYVDDTSQFLNSLVLTLIWCYLDWGLPWSSYLYKLQHLG